MRNIIIFILTLVASTLLYSAPSLYEQGENARRAGNVSEARKYYFRFFTRNPHSELAPRAMFRYALSNIPYQDAVTYLKRILKDYPNFSDKIKIMDKMAMLHYLKENYVECIRVLDDVIKNPAAKAHDKLRSYYYIGKSYFLMNRFDRANHFYLKIIQSGENAYTPLARLEMGEILLKERKYTLARHAFESVVQKYPESEAELKAVYRLGSLYTLARDLTKAKAAYTYIVQSYPMSVEASFAKKKLEELNNRQIPMADNEESAMTRQMSQNEIEEREIAAREAMNNSSARERSETPGLTQPRNSVKLTLHLGNYRSRAYAAGLQKKLLNRGYKAYIIKRKIRGIQYFTLRVGNYDTRSEAEKKAKEIISQLQLRVSIIDRT